MAVFLPRQPTLGPAANTWGAPEMPLEPTCLEVTRWTFRVTPWGAVRNSKREVCRPGLAEVGVQMEGPSRLYRERTRQRE